MVVRRVEASSSDSKVEFEIEIGYKSGIVTVFVLHENRVKSEVLNTVQRVEKTDFSRLLSNFIPNSEPSFETSQEK